MTTKHKLIASLIAIPLLFVGGYYLLSPKVIVTNLSDTAYDEFVVSLPASRISFSPVEARSSITIFYSRQKKSGVGAYSLRAGRAELQSNNFPYVEGSEFGRVLRFTIDGAGRVNLEE